MSTEGAPTIIALAPGHARVERVLRASPFVIGREGHADLGFDFGWLSRRHLVFEETPAGWVVHSEGRNEVRVDGAVLRGRVLLDPGARIDVGPMAVIFGDRQALDLDDGDLGSATMELTADAIARSESRRHLHLLGQVSGQLALASTLDEVTRLAADAVLEVTGARAAYVIAWDGRAEVLGARGGRIRRVSRALIERVSAGRSTVTYASAASSPDLKDRQSIVGESVGPVIAAPIGSPTQGVLYADRELGTPAFSETDAVFVTVLAQLLGPAIHAAKAHEADVHARARAEAERTALAREIERRGHFGRLIGSSAPMRKLASNIAKVAPTDATALILGETGVGKELVAREIHQRSDRKDGAFFAINCAALPDALLESELFGHKKGAFTGADKDRRGLFELAEQGTVFLDEIGELSATAQAKVLRVLETREVLPLGADRPIAVSVRLIAATHRDLVEEVKEQRFRRDLYYRLSVFPLTIPALRERPEDIGALIEHFLERSAEARKKRLRKVSPAALAAFTAHDYPGNVRELAHVIERAAILAEVDQTIGLEHLPDELVEGTPPEGDAEDADPEAAPGPETLRAAVERFERAFILRELERGHWNRTKTARVLDVSLRAFMRKLKHYGLKES